MIPYINYENSISFHRNCIKNADNHQNDKEYVNHQLGMSLLFAIKHIYSEKDFCNMDLHEINLNDMVFLDNNLSGSNLKKATMINATLIDNNLSNVDLRDAILRGADLRRSNLSGADLRGADLTDADLRGCNLSNIITDEITKGISQVCPESGSFIGYKKVRINKHRKYKDTTRVYQPSVIVELEIPEDALRSSATTNKCRCSKAKVLSITTPDGRKCRMTEVYNQHFQGMLYKVGEISEVKNFDTDRWNECSNGIHFFMTREEAVKYII